MKTVLLANTVPGIKQSVSYQDLAIKKALQ